MKKLTAVSILIAVAAVLAPLAAWAFVPQWDGVAASQRFVWQAPEPQGNSITAVDFVTETIGWAVGVNGTVIKTTDGGVTWAQQGPVAVQGADDTVDDLNDVCFVDANNGWATGANKVWRTVNGGASWADCAPESYTAGGVPSYWSSVEFVDANNGWLVGREHIYHTTNGGLTWTAQTNPTGSNVNRVIAVSNTEAFAFGVFEGYLATSNGGDSWVEKTFEGTEYAASWTDSMAAASSSRLYAATGGAVLSSSNGGSTWTTMTIGPDIDEVCTVDGVSTGTYAWAFSSGGNVYATTNGGGSWTPGSAVPSYPSSPDAPTASTVYLTTGDVYVSTDGGTFFTRQAHRVSNQTLAAVDFSSETTGHAVGGSDYLRTTDGGSTWEMARDVDPLSANDIFFLGSDPLVGWIVGDSPTGVAKVLKTADGGDTWESLDETRTALREVCFPDANNGWGTNNSWGGFWHSTDGGESWVKVDRPGFYWDVDFVDTNRGWIALDPDDGTNRVLHTTDGGSTWTTQTVPPSGGSIQQLDFVDANNGWCADTFANVYQTADGGTTWTKLRLGPDSTVDITDMKFVSPTKGWIVGEQWTTSMLSSYRHDFAGYTDDGGASWDFLRDEEPTPFEVDKGSTGSAVHVNAVDSVGGTTCWVVGGGGSILKGTAPTPRTTTLSRTSGSATLSAYGKSYTFRGRLTSEGRGLEGKKVMLQAGPTASGPFSNTSAWTYTRADGTFSITVTPRSKTYYRVRYDGTTRLFGASTSTATWVLPRPSVGTPKAPKTMSTSKYYTVYGYLKPRHAKGTYPVRIYRWKRTSSGKWKSYGYLKAKASNYSSYTKYARKIRLSSAGKWRLRAYAPADTGHAAAWSSGYDYVTVK